MDFLLAGKLLLVLFAANGAPILAHNLFGTAWNHPIDRGHRLKDGQPILGPAKTWRGVIAALLITPPVAVLLSLSPLLGLAIAALAMLGDLLSSFIKRRLFIPPSGMAFGLDQVPESLLPLLVAGEHLDMDWADIALLTLVFLALELVLSRILYRLHIRNQPY